MKVIFSFVVNLIGQQPDFATAFAESAVFDSHSQAALLTWNRTLTDRYRDTQVELTELSSWHLPIIEWLHLGLTAVKTAGD